MQQQVITIRPDGSLAGLQHKPGKGLDLREFGRASIERASEVLWDTSEQKWYVEFRKGSISGERLTVSLLAAACLTTCEGPQDRTAYFEDYDGAVDAEIRVLNMLRLADPSKLD